MIEAEASRALVEMRAMVRVLRNQEARRLRAAARRRGPGRLAGAPATGPRVEVKLSVTSRPSRRRSTPPCSALPQEAVTNALRHARNATLVEVCVDGALAVVRLPVRDDGDQGRAGSHGSGFGIVGMVERPPLLGGTCRRPGPRPGVAGRGDPAPGDDPGDNPRAGRRRPGPRTDRATADPRPRKASRSSARRGTDRRRSGWPVSCDPMSA